MGSQLVVDYEQERTRWIRGAAAAQLAEFVASVTAAESETMAALLAVERAAESLDADVAAIVAYDEVLAAVGYPEGIDPVGELRRVEPGLDSTVEVPGVGPSAAAGAWLEHPPGAKLVVARAGPDTLTRQEVALLRAMARVASVTMQMQRLLDDERRARLQVERLAGDQEALRRVATLVAEAAPREHIYAAVAEEIARRLGADVVILLRYEPNSQSSVIGGWAIPGIGLPIGSRLNVAGQGAAVLILHTGRPARVERFEGPPDSVAGFLLSVGIRSGVGSPIVVEDELWGAAIAGSRHLEAPPAGSESQIAEFTELVATAIANAEARAQLRDIAEEQTELRRLATLVARGAPPDAVFAAVAVGVGRAVPEADVSLVGRYSADGVIEFVGGWKRDGEAAFVGDRVPVGGHNVTTLVFEGGGPARVEELRDEPMPASMLARQLARSSAGAPITVEGRLWGVMIVASLRPGGLPTGIENELADFTELVATAIANADGRAQLLAARRRVIEATDAARARLARDIHDGAQQQFLTALIDLQLAQQKRTSDSVRSWELVDLGVGQVETGLETLRELAAGVHPAVLSDMGLKAALEAFATRMPMPLSVKVDDLQFPAGVEASIYFFCSEALTNVVKHAAASAASVRVEAVDGQLRVEVRDDGIGGAEIGSRGTGLIGLYDRIGALEGSLSVSSPPGGIGTTLVARLPLSR